MDTAKLVTFSMALLIVQACSHPIEIVGQGDVTSHSGDRNCSLEQFTEGDDVCSKNYAIGAYQETFNPWPRAGWKFDHWGNYCADSTPPTYDCSFDYTAEQVRQFWFVTVPPLQAVFIPVPPPDPDGDGLDNDVDPCPANPTNPCALIADTVSVNGSVWAQVDLFTNLSWRQINDVCPAGICKKDGILNGYDMGGWTWASIDDCNALFNTYVGLDASLGPGPDSLLGYGSRWAPAFFAAGWRPTSVRPPSTVLPGSRSVGGVSRDVISEKCYSGKRLISSNAFGACSMLDYVTDLPINYLAVDTVTTSYVTCSDPNTPLGSPYVSSGAWFYR
jgi:hypothetical protein